MIYQQQGLEFESTHDVGITGLDGTIAFRIVDGQGNVVTGPTTAGVVESGDSGLYTWTGTAPATLGQYAVEASTDATFDVGTVSVDELTVVTAEAIADLPALTPVETGEGDMVGPCQAWVDGDTVAERCSAFEEGSSTAILDDYARTASEILFPLSGSIFTGLCGPIKVRPCADGCACFGFSVRYGWSWDASVSRWRCGGRACGCSPTSEVRLAGHVREITEVKIDGVALDPEEYRLDGRRVVRMRDADDPNRRLVWPGCQVIDLEDTEEGTFSISYTYGVDPPQSGIDAATALACQLYSADVTGECDLPDNVKSVVRQGISWESASIIGAALALGMTGIPSLDSFLAPYGSQRPSSAVWSPDLPWPRRVGQAGS